MIVSTAFTTGTTGHSVAAVISDEARSTVIAAHARSPNGSR